MFRILVLVFALLLFSSNTKAQVVLSADGAVNTYELINSVMAPNYNVVEVPDCVHTSFGRHIDKIFDTDLNKMCFVFSLMLHKIMIDVKLLTDNELK